MNTKYQNEEYLTIEILKILNKALEWDGPPRISKENIVNKFKNHNIKRLLEHLKIKELIKKTNKEEAIFFGGRTNTYYEITKSGMGLLESKSLSNNLNPKEIGSYQNYSPAIPPNTSISDSKSNKKFDVFLSYNKTDKNFVKDTALEIEKKGLKPWFDKLIRPGDNWVHELQEVIKEIKIAAVFFGKNGVGQWQKEEISILIKKHVEEKYLLIPVILRECKGEPDIPIFLQGLNYVDFRSDDYDPIDQLCFAIRNGNLIK